jgi:hypothetical protein
LYINFQPTFKKFAVNPMIQGAILQSAPADTQWILQVEANRIPEYARRVQEARQAHQRNPNEKTLRDLTMAEGYLARAEMAADAYLFPQRYPYTHKALTGGRTSLPFNLWMEYARNWLSPIPDTRAAEAYKTIAEGLTDPTLLEERWKAEYNYYLEDREHAIEQILDAIFPHRHIVEDLSVQQRQAEIEREKEKRRREMEEYRRELERRRPQ